MKNYIYQLNFVTPVRFGVSDHSVHLANSTYYSDGELLFSLISNEWIDIYGKKSYIEFIEEVKNNKVLLSGLFPYYKDQLYVPKPIIHIEREKNTSGKEENSSVIKKKMKKLNFIPISHFNDYIGFLKGTKDLSFDYVTDFTTEVISTKASISRNAKGDALPYVVSGYRFRKDAGLYFILKTTKEIKEKFDIIINSLGTSGIGGKRSLGYGKFELMGEPYELDKEYPVYDCDIHLLDLLESKGDYYMALSVVKPNEKDIRNFDTNRNFYKITKKSGFVFSKDYSYNLIKKKDSYVFDKGACFKKKITGQLVDVSTNRGKHPVYLYGKSMYLGVKL